MVDGILVWGTVIYAAYLIYPIYPLIAYAQIPYIIWTTIAGVLIVEVNQMN